MNKKPLLVVFLTVFIDLVGFGMIIPLSPYLAQNFGASPLQVGLLMAIYSGAQFLFSPFWGHLSDRVGRRPVILISLLGAGLSHLSFGLAESLWILFLVRGLAGVFGANISTAMAAVADITDEKNRSKGMGLVGAAFGLGFVLGPAMGGFLSKYGFSAPAFGAAAICLTNAVFAFFVLPETRITNKGDQVLPKNTLSRFKRLKKHFQRKDVSILLVCSFALSVALANMEASLFLLVKDRLGWGLEPASYGFAYVGIMMAFTQGFLIRKLLPVFGEVQLIKFGAVSFGLGMLTVGLSYRVEMMALGMTALALGSGLFNPSVLGLVSLKSSKDEQGEVMGVMQSLAAIARILGPPVGGFLYGVVGSSSPFLLATALAVLVWLAVFWKLKSGSGVGPSDPAKIDLGNVLLIGRFQIENVLRNPTPVMFISFLDDTELENLKKHPGWASAAWIFARAQALKLDEFRARTSQAKFDRSYPIVLMCRFGDQSKAVVGDLDREGFLNVFAIRGGAHGLLDSAD